MCDLRFFNAPTWATPLPFEVYPDGIRHIRADRRVNEWKAPGKRTIIKCALNRRQVAIALAGGEIVYFELDVVGSFIFSCARCKIWEPFFQKLIGTASGDVLLPHSKCTIRYRKAANRTQVESFSSDCRWAMPHRITSRRIAYDWGGLISFPWGCSNAGGGGRERTRDLHTVVESSLGILRSLLCNACLPDIFLRVQVLCIPTNCSFFKLCEWGSFYFLENHHLSPVCTGWLALPEKICSGYKWGRKRKI